MKFNLMKNHRQESLLKLSRKTNLWLTFPHCSEVCLHFFTHDHHTRNTHHPAVTCPATDTHPGGLECCTLQWHGEDQPLGLPLLCGTHDLWKLCAFQLAGGHPRGGLLCRGKRACPAYWPPVHNTARISLTLRVKSSFFWYQRNIINVCFHLSFI